MGVSPQLARYYKLRDQINAKRRQYRAEHRALVNLQAKEYRDTRREEIRRCEKCLDPNKHPAPDPETVDIVKILEGKEEKC